MVKSTWPGVSMRWMLVAAPLEGGGGGGDGDAALALLGHPVHLGLAVVHLADLVDASGVEEEALADGGLAGVDVRDDADVAHARELRRLGRLDLRSWTWRAGDHSRRGNAGLEQGQLPRRGGAGARHCGSSLRTEFTRVETGRAASSPSGAGCSSRWAGRPASQAAASSALSRAGMRSCTGRTQRVRRGRQHREPPRLPQPGHQQQLAVGAVEPERLPPVGGGAPLVEAVGRHHAAPAPEGGPEGRPRGRGLRARVEQRRPALPGRRQPPARRLEPPPPVDQPQDGCAIGGRDVVAGAVGGRRLGRRGWPPARRRPRAISRLRQSHPPAHGRKSSALASRRRRYSARAHDQGRIRRRARAAAAGISTAELENPGSYRSDGVRALHELHVLPGLPRLLPLHPLRRTAAAVTGSSHCRALRRLPRLLPLRGQRGLTGRRPTSSSARSCTDCTYCYGCVGLAKKEFHILNVPYSRTEYFALAQGPSRRRGRATRRSHDGPRAVIQFRAVTVQALDDITSGHPG